MQTRQHVQTQLQCGAGGQSINHDVTETSQLLGDKDPPCHDSDARSCLAESLVSPFNISLMDFNNTNEM